MVNGKGNAVTWQKTKNFLPFGLLKRNYLSVPWNESYHFGGY